jgi:hypothetical protein
MPSGWLSPRGRVLGRAGLGVLTWVVPPGLVDEAVADGLAWEMRLRELPARVAVYFTLGLCLFSALPYGQVLRRVTGGLEAALAAAGWAVPSATALTGARRRAGERALEGVFTRLCSALSPGRAPWSHLGGLLVTAWDGTTLAVPDTPANAAAFGRPGAGRRRGGAAAAEPRAQFPQARLVALVACGTRALLGAAIGPVRGPGSGEGMLARDLLGCLRPGMLLLADRGFYSYSLWTAAAAAGPELLWRARGNLLLPPLLVLPDGSWLSRARAPQREKENGKNGARRREPPPPPVTVRVIGFAVTVAGDDGSSRTERYRLITTLLDHRAYPASTLASCYARRWAAETAYAELKTALLGPGRVLRSRDPALARQEIWAALAVCQAIRTVIARAAAGAGLDPARVSFTAALHACRQAIAPGSLAAALAAAEAEITSPRALVPVRPGRVFARAVKRPRSGFPMQRQPPGTARHASYALAITPPPTMQTTSHQHKQAETKVSSPP